MRFKTPAAVALLTLATLALPLAGQKNKEPRRPKLPAAADTNDPQAYYEFALAKLGREPQEAADALYWSTRLNPLGADFFYARRIALLLSDPGRLLKYWTGDKRTAQSDEVRRIDSLYYRALTLNPFLSQTLERELFEGVLEEYARSIERAGGGSAGEVRYELDRIMATAPASMRAWQAYTAGRFEDALTLYAQAIKSAGKKASGLRMSRAQIFFQTNRVDSALVEVTKAIEEMRGRDKKDFIYVYESKALAEHSIASINLRLGKVDGAKEALGRALQEDLSYYPAHVQLAFIALEAKDTTNALAEMDLAVQLRADDGGARYLYGFTLASAGKHADAETQLRKAIELEPRFAAPHVTLGEVLEKQGRRADAVKEYQTFLTLAPRNDVRREQAQSRLAASSDR